MALGAGSALPNLFTKNRPWAANPNVTRVYGLPAHQLASSSSRPEAGSLGRREAPAVLCNVSNEARQVGCPAADPRSQRYESFVTSNIDVSQRQSGQGRSATPVAAAAAAIAALDLGQQLVHWQQQHKRQQQPGVEVSDSLQQDLQPGTQQLKRPRHVSQLQPQQQHAAQLLPLPGRTAPSAVGRSQQLYQQQHHGGVLPHPFCTLDHPLLTHRIKQCTTWHEAAVLFAQQAQCMNHINLAALITHLAQRKCSARNKPVNWRAFISQVLAASEPQLNLCSTRQLSNMAWGFASINYNDWVNPSYSWTVQWQQQLLLQLHKASCRDMCNILWAVAASVSGSSSSRQQPLVMQERPHVLSDVRFQQELLSALHRELPSSTSQDVANALWALATLNISPSLELQQFLLARAQIHFSHLKPQEAAQTLWGLAQLKTQPPTGWVGELLLHQVSHPGVSMRVGDEQQGAGASKLWQVIKTPGGLSDQVGGQELQSQNQQQQQHGGQQQRQQQAARTPGVKAQQQGSGRADTSARRQDQHQNCALTAGTGPSQQQDAVSCSRSRSSRQPSQQRQRRQQQSAGPSPGQQKQRQQSRGVLGETSPQNLVICLVACAQLKQLPPDKWLQQTLVQLEVLLLRDSSRGGHDVAANPLGGGGSRSDKHHLANASRSGRSGTKECSSKSITSSVCCSSQSIDHASSSNALHPSSSSSSSSNTCSSQDLANTIWALGDLGIKPHAAWMNNYLFASSRVLHTAKPQELCNMIWGLARLGVRPNPVWLDRFDTASAACMWSFTAQGLADVLSSQVYLGLKPAEAWAETWAQALKACWGSADAAAMCKILWAAAKCNIDVDRHWLQDALMQSHEELQRALNSQQLTHEELLRLVWAVGVLSRGVQNPSVSNMLGLHCCHAAAKMSWKQLSRTAQGLRKLKPLPRQQLVCYFCDLVGSRVKYMPAEQGLQVTAAVQKLRSASARLQLQQQQEEQRRRHNELAWQYMQQGHEQRSVLPAASCK